MKLKKVAGLVLAASVVAAAIAVPASSATAASKKYSLGLVAFDMTNSTTARIWAGMQAEAKKLGYTTTMIDSMGTPDKANSAIQTLVAKKVSLIITQVFPAVALASGIASAQAANIPIESIGGGTGTGVESAWDFGTGPGKASGVEALALNGGKGALLKLGYKPGIPCLTRESSFDAAVAGKSSYKVTRQEIQFPGQVQISTQYTAAWLTANPASAGVTNTVWACTDDAAVGAAAAVASAARTDIKIVTIDGTPEAIKGIQDGSIAAAAWIDGFGVGKQVVDKLAATVKTGMKGAVLMQPPFQVVTPANLKAFLKAHPEALG